MKVYITLIILFLLIFGLGTWLTYRASQRKSPSHRTPK
jgi:hypothetical protein